MVCTSPKWKSESCASLLPWNLPGIVLNDCAFLLQLDFTDFTGSSVMPRPWGEPLLGDGWVARSPHVTAQLHHQLRKHSPGPRVLLALFFFFQIPVFLFVGSLEQSSFNTKDTSTAWVFPLRPSGNLGSRQQWLPHWWQRRGWYSVPASVCLLVTLAQRFHLRHCFSAPSTVTDLIATGRALLVPIVWCFYFSHSLFPFSQKALRSRATVSLKYESPFLLEKSCTAAVGSSKWCLERSTHLKNPIPKLPASPSHSLVRRAQEACRSWKHHITLCVRESYRCPNRTPDIGRSPFPFLEVPLE